MGLNVQGGGLEMNIVLDDHSIGASISKIEKDLNKLTTATVQGTQAMGVAASGSVKSIQSLGGAVETTAAKGGLLKKGFSFLSNAASFIPGLSLASVITTLAEATVDLVIDLIKGANAFPFLQQK
jgi:hypothetical protein